MTEPGKPLDAQMVASAQRRLGFVALLWWIAAVSGILGLLQGRPAGVVRMLFIGISLLLAVFFTYAWWTVRKGRLLS